MTMARRASAETEPLVGRDTTNDLQDTRSWWKRQSPWWCVFTPIQLLYRSVADLQNGHRALTVAPLLTSTVALVMAPKIEVYTALACMSHKPEVFSEPFRAAFSVVGSALHHVAADSLPQVCATDPEVRRVVAKLSAG